MDAAVVDAKVAGILVLALTVGLSAGPMLLRPYFASSHSKATVLTPGKQRRKKGTSQPEAQGTPQAAAPQPHWAPGDPVLARYEGEWWPATVRTVGLEKGHVEVLWDSEFSVSVLAPCDLVPHQASTEEAAPPASAVRDDADASALADGAAQEEAAAGATAATVPRGGSALPEATFLESVAFQQQRDLAMQVRAISMEAFSEDATQTQKGEKVCALLIQGEVVGYASYQVRPSLGSLNCNKLAVPSHRRRQGLGRCLVRHLIQLGKRPLEKKAGAGSKGGAQQRPLEVLCLSALPTAINFYKACGFREEKAVRLPEEEGEELEEGQATRPAARR
jgi:GNAT superfamily N-acetyltransferase